MSEKQEGEIEIQDKPQEQAEKGKGKQKREPKQPIGEKKQQGENKSKPEKQKPAKGGKGEKVNAAQCADVTFAAKKSDFPEWYDELMTTAGIIDKRLFPSSIKGMPVFLPYGYQMHLRIMKLFEEEYQKLGIKMTQFPAFIPRSFLEKEADHVKGFQSECFWHEDECCLRPTSETAMYTMFHNWVHTADDLPLMVQQTCNVYRYETKGTKPLIRVREIPWNEAHTAHATPEEVLEILDEYWKIVHRIFHERLTINGLRLRRPDWDRFPGAEYTDVLDVVMPCGRVLQAISAHNLGQHFSKVFDIQVDGTFAYMECIGVSTRALAAVLSTHGDDKGLVLPSVIAPYQVIMTPIITKKGNQELIAKCQEIRTALETVGLRVRIDTNDQKRAGEKYFYYEMKGVPLRIELGPRDLAEGKCTIVIRGIEGKREINIADVTQQCVDALKAYDDALRARAQAHLESRIVDCNDFDKLPEILEKGGFARIPFFTMGKEGKEAVERIHEKCGGEIRGWIPTEEQPGEGVKCLLTGKPAKFWAYIARAY